MGSSDVQRRMYKRVQIEVKLRYLLPLDTFDRVWTASTFDIGQGGIGLVAEKPLKDGTAMIVELDPKYCDIKQEVIRIQAQVIWCEPKNGAHHMGVMFYYFNEKLRARVSAFVDAIDHLAPSPR